MSISLRQALRLAVGPANVDAAGHAVADWFDGRGLSGAADLIREHLQDQPDQPAPDAVPHDRPDTSLRSELMAKLATQREVILSLCDRVERLEMRADGLSPIERVERRWAKEKAGGDKLDRLIAQDQEADEPAVPEGREPASVVEEPSDRDLRQLYADTFDLRSDPASLGPAIVKFARAVLARWGHQSTPPVEGELGDEARRLAKELRDQADDMSPALELFGLMHRAADLLEQRHPEPVPVSERLPVDVEQALIKAECALSDIAEGEPEGNDGDSDALLQWAEQRAATALSRIRPVMRLHGILTSEYPPLPATALPLPAGEGQTTSTNHPTNDE